MIKNLDTTSMQTRTTGIICNLVHNMQREIKRLSLANNRANEDTKDILRKSSYLLRIRKSEIGKTVTYNTDEEYYKGGV